MPIKIGIFEVREDWEKKTYLELIDQKLKDFLRNLEICFFEEPLDEFVAHKYTELNIAVIYIKSRVNKKVLEKLVNLELVITRTTGTDHIDILNCQKKGVKVANSPHYASVTVAEHTMALIFTLSKRIHVAIRKSKMLDFSRIGLLGMDLINKTIGIIGTGRIGREIARLAYGVGMKILAYDILPDKMLEEKYKVQYVSLECLLKESDVIVVMVPYYPKTHHMINRENIKLVKDEAILINTARGPIVDTEAIIWALQNGKLKGGIALDVFEGERVLLEMSEVLGNKFSPEEYERALKTLHLLSYPNTIFTPHTAHYTKDAIKRDIVWVIENLSEFLKFRELPVKYQFYF